MKRVTFEQGVILKKLDFFIHNRILYYHKDTKDCREVLSKNYCIPCPTLYEVCDWLREEHQLYVVPSPLYIEESKDSNKVVCDAWCAILMDLEEKYTSEQLDIDPYEFTLFHEAQSAGIDKALEILEEE